MALTFLGEDPGSRSVTHSLGEITARRVLQWESSSQSDDEFDVLADANCPNVGSAHPRYSSLWLQSRTVNNVNPWKGWQVELSYSSKVELSETPTSDPIRISWGTEQFQRPLVFDKNGDAVVNSAGDPFDPPPMIDDSRRTVTIRVNVASVPSYISSYQDTVNSDQFVIDGFTVNIGQAKIQSITVSEPQVRNETTYREITITMHIQKDGWKIEPLDAGFREIDGAGRKNIVNSIDGEEPTSPVPLNGSGVVLAAPTPSTAVFLEFDAYATAAYISNIPGCTAP